MMQTFRQDLRYAARMLRMQKSLTAIAIFSLALRLGANTAIFGLVDKLLLQSLPVRAPQTLVRVQANSVKPPLTFNEFS